MSLSILAFDAEGLVPFAFFVISIIVAIINQVRQAKQKDKQKPPEEARVQGDSSDPIKNEIEAFLREVNKGRQGRRPANSRPSEPLEITEIEEPIEGLDIEEIEEAPRRRRPQRSKPLRKDRAVKRTQRRQPEPAPKKHSRPGGRIANRHMDRENLGSGVEQHVSERMQSHVAKDAEGNLAHNVDNSVREHLGEFTARTLKRDKSESTKDQFIIELLKSSSGLRNAIILNEILTRPKSRNRGES